MTARNVGTLPAGSAQLLNRVLKPPPFPRQYSARLVRSDGLVLVVHVDVDRHRKESSYGGKTAVEISRLDRGLAWLVDPKRAIYREMRLLSEFMSDPPDPDAGYQWSADGHEEIDGRRCARLLGSQPPDERTQWLYWVDTQTEFRRRMINYGRSGTPRLTVDYHNVVLGPPDAAVFELPEGLRPAGTQP